MQFTNPEGGEYQAEHFMKIDEVKVWFNMTKMIRTCGRELEIRQLIARNIKVNVEKEGYVFGNSNISEVMKQMEKNINVWLMMSMVMMRIKKTRM